MNLIVRLSRVFLGVPAELLGLLLCLSTTPAWSQATSTRTVTGQVTDQQSAAIVGADVRLVDASTNTVRTTSSNETGRYVFVNVSSGTYKSFSCSTASAR